MLIDESTLTGESDAGSEGARRHGWSARPSTERQFRQRRPRSESDSSALAQIVKLVQQAIEPKALAQPLADKAAQWLVIAAIAIGLATAVWFF